MRRPFGNSRAPASRRLPLRVGAGDRAAEGGDRVAGRHELVRDVTGKAGLGDGAGDGGPMEFLVQVQFPAARHAGGVIVGDPVMVVADRPG